MSDNARRTVGIVLIALGAVLIVLFLAAKNTEPAPIPTDDYKLRLM